MTPSQFKRIAPNISEKIWLYRPLMAEPPLCTMLELKVLTIDDIADLHEVLDLKEHLAAKAAEAAPRPK